MARAQIYLGSWEDNPEEGFMRLFNQKPNDELISIRPGIQKIWESYYLVIDGEIVMEHHRLPYKPIFNESDLEEYRDAGAVMGLNMARAGLNENDYEIVNGKKVDFTDSVKTVRLIDGVEVEEEKVGVLRKSLLTVLNRLRGVAA